MTAPPTPEPLWEIEDVSAYLRVPVQTLYQWRKRKYGPPAARVGRHLRYDPASVRAWFTDQSKAA
ncbi:MULTISPECIES: helix-turn-helix domain-containing protein [Micromonospora]|uniref:DNA-binding transcriptional regulator AlpA n=1 Tax=Micromonospora ureilytica TaxID=709868 RepID=A0ABS0JQY7_9ACTN|nr:helix-turn-helix domain-containing protein [Micromonospora ureilytica]MBG6069369.1 putative DNA-binding transcriptional regulator AlpA [Micromonospora ureilytica]WSZ76246.1 helix-turn-helix domain-containing protein [Micromonospora sp. NBC_00860]